METFESLTLTEIMPIFYRRHKDVAHGGEVDTLTETGLKIYFERRQMEEEAALRNTALIMDYDLDAGASFSANAQTELRMALSGSCEGRKSFIIHRDGHTVSVIREGDTFLLLDSYNAHGTKDCDHFPLLQIIREENPKAKIYTLHDKTQNDYYSCRIFSVENLVEIEKFCAEHHCGLSEIIKDSMSVPFFYGEPDKAKDEFYAKNGIVPIGTPVPILHHVQSMEYIVSAFNRMLDSGNAESVEYVFKKLHPHLKVSPKPKPKPRSRLQTSLHEIVNSAIEGLSCENARKLEEYQEVANALLELYGSENARKLEEYQEGIERLIVRLIIDEITFSKKSTTNPKTKAELQQQ